MISGEQKLSDLNSLNVGSETLPRSLRVKRRNDENLIQIQILNLQFETHDKILHFSLLT